MQSPPGNPELPNVVRLCGSIQGIIEDHVNSYPATDESDIGTLRLEVKTLHHLLALVEKVRAAKEPRWDIEESHLRDVSTLLRRCDRTLLNLHKSLKQIHRPNGEVNGQAQPWDLKTSTFAVPRFYISFYTRTLQVSLIGCNLIHRWKSHHHKNGVEFNWDELSESTRQLRMTVIQRRNLTGGGDHEESVEEMGLLRDVEQCVKSVEGFMSVTPSRLHEAGQLSLQHLAEVPPLNEVHPLEREEADLPWRNGSRTSSSPPNSKMDPPSDDSEVESIDYIPEGNVGFSVEVYSTMIAALLRELRHKMENRNFRDAEIVCKTIARHSRDREAKLGIPFDNRTELDMILAEVQLEQRRYQKVKRLARQLLLDNTLDPDQRSKLHMLLAKAYFGRSQWPKAETCAQSSLRTREQLHGREHRLTQESAALLIKIFEQQKDNVTANALRDIYCPHTLPSPPSRSALRPVARRRPDSPTNRFRDTDTVKDQAPPDYQEESHPHGKKHLRWARNVWGNDLSINAPINESGQTRLIYGIHLADDEYVKLIIARKANVDKACAKGVSPLMHAVALGHESIVELLLKEGAKVDNPTSGWTPLHKATDAGNLAIMRLLIASGANIEAQSPLEYVQPKSETARLRALADDEPDPRAEIEPEEDHRWTPLLRAANKGHEAAVRLLLDFGANIEARSPSNATPLMYACQEVHFPTVDLLSMRGADIHAADQYGWKPLHYALVNVASRSNDAEQISHLLLSHEADVNAKCNFNKSPLHYAVEKCGLEMVLFLLNSKADMEARDIAEQTPLHAAIACRSEPMVRLLLKQGADASAMNRGGEDALAAAQHAERKSPEIIALLKENKKMMKRENSDASKGRVGRKVSMVSGRKTSVGMAAGTGAGDAIPEGSKIGGKKGWFGSKSRKDGAG
ncbi:MAG: hypothetical protein Q9216_006175 [Gyalolechia sp. 2 TL-2023]